jgi:hypothetical protein
VSRPAATLGLALALLAAAAPLPAQPGPKADPKADPPKKAGFGGRTGAEKKRLLKDFGGSRESEDAVMLGLAWLSQQQKQDGGWEFDRGHTPDRAAATGLAVLAFTGAGQSHRAGLYRRTMQDGVDWLVKNLDQNGRFDTISNMYSQGIATLALVEAYGLTQDPALKGPAELAVGYVQRAQAPDGSWGYQAANPGDTSIVGWQIQALHAARVAGLDVDDRVVRRAVAFLDRVGSGPGKSAYGYTTPPGSPGTSLTAIGLLLRYYVDGWKDTTPGFAEGVKGLVARAPRPNRRPQFDMYYYYYAAQVVRYHGGDAWRDWNEGPVRPDGTRAGGVPDWLISLQVREKDIANRGSWEPDQTWIGQHCGRLGTTCLCLLTLEVYYRYDTVGDENKP